MQGSSLEAGQLRFSTVVETASRDEWQQGSQQVEGPPREASSVLLSNILHVALGRSLEAEVNLPVAWMDAKDEMGSVSRSGIGDLLTRIAWSGSNEAWSWGASAGMFFPVGELGDQDLPATATFSTGTYDPSVGAYLTGPSVRSVGWHLSADTRLVVGERDDGSRLGSSFTGVLGLNRRLAGRLNAQLLFAYFGRGRDKGNEMEDTGGDWLYMQPFLTADLYVHPSYALQVLVGGRVPLMQNVRGTQLVESPSFSIGFAQTIRF